jgi:NTP pyrophosphatase (non-canonical NTP hydrolase)
MKILDVPSLVGYTGRAVRLTFNIPGMCAMDDKTTVEKLKRLVIEFRDRRNWKQYHDVKNLSMGLAVECAELQELFLWKSREEIAAFLAAETDRQRLREELADVFVFLLYLSEETGVDLSEAVRDKLAVNEKKYPVEKSYNSNRKYTEL